MSKAIPVDFNSLSPHIVVPDIAAAIEFYTKAFGAEEKCKIGVPGTNQIIHAELKLGNSTLMLGGEMENSSCTAKSPAKLGGSPVVIHFYVDKVDDAYKTAIAAGAREVMPPTDMFWGDRYSRLTDPFGHEWSIATKVRDMSQEEMQAAAQECFSQMQPAS